MSYQSEVLADSPLGYWRLGDTSGTTMTDLSGNGHHGTYSSMTLGTIGTVGDTDTAVTATGTGSYGKVTGGSWMNTATWTVEFWVKFAAGGNVRFMTREAGPGQSVTPDYVWSTQAPSTGVLETVTFDSGGNVIRTSGGKSVGDGKWHHVAATFDGTTVKTYIDGVLGGSSTTTVYRSNVTDIVLANARQTAGADLTYGTAGLSLDEAAFYGTALSATRVKAHFTAALDAMAALDSMSSPYSTAVMADTPLAYWKLNDAGTNAALLDYSGNHRHLLVFGTPTFGSAKKAPGLDGSSLGVAGGNDDADGGYIPATDHSFFTSLTTFSIEAWTRSPSAYSTIFSIYNSSYGPDAKQNVFARYNGSGQFEFGASSASAGQSIASPANIASNTAAHHVVATYNAGSVKLYVDGVLVNSTTGFVTPASGTGTPLRIGSGTYQATPTPYAAFNGELQAISLYSSELSLTRIQAHYNAGSALYVGLAASSTMSASGAVSAGSIAGAAAMSATSSMSASGSATAAGAVALSATASLSASGVVTGIASGAAALTAASSLTASGTTSAAAPIVSGTTALAASSSLTASGATTAAVVTASIALAATSSIVAVASVTTPGSDPVDPDPPDAGPDPASDVQVSAATSVLETPAWLDVSVTNATPDGALEFFVEGVQVFDVVADDAGQAVGMSVPLALMDAGTYDLLVTDVESGRSTTVSFDVTQDPAATPEEPAGPAAPTPPPVVTRWTLENPAPGGEVLTFPTNPARMSNPHAARVFTTEHTTSPTGQPLVFEGEPVAVDWSIEGTCLTQEFYEALERFQALPQRCYLTDHLSRTWVVTFEALDWAQLRDRRYPWGHTYRAKFLIYAGPLEV